MEEIKPMDKINNRLNSNKISEVETRSRKITEYSTQRKIFQVLRKDILSI